MKRVCQENKVRWCSQFSNVVSVARYEIAIRYSVFGEPMACDLQQGRVDINRRNVPSDLCYLKGEPTVAGTKVNYGSCLHVSLPPQGRPQDQAKVLPTTRRLAFLSPEKNLRDDRA
jgi:hypothetical protein